MPLCIEYPVGITCLNSQFCQGDQAIKDVLWKCDEVVLQKSPVQAAADIEHGEVEGDFSSSRPSTASLKQFTVLVVIGFHGRGQSVRTSADVCIFRETGG